MLPATSPIAAAHDLGVEERHRPAAVPEAAVGVLLGAAGGLHDAVEADELADHDSHAPDAYLGPDDVLIASRRARGPRRTE